MSRAYGVIEHAHVEPGRLTRNVTIDAVPDYGRCEARPSDAVVDRRIARPGHRQVTSERSARGEQLASVEIEDSELGPVRSRFRQPDGNESPGRARLGELRAQSQRANGCMLRRIEDTGVVTVTKAPQDRRTLAYVRMTKFVP